MDPAVRAIAVSKIFAPPSPRARLLDWVAHQARRAPAVPSSGLRELSFEVPAGEWLGLIGHNGAAKTTLLRLLAGIYRPTSGRVEVRGRVVLLAGLGIGMVDDLSVRENVVLYGSIYGLPRAQTRSLLPEILGWAGLAEHADAVVATLSSGMRTRLAFSCIRHVSGDVWLFDEVLSVGDREFREQCNRHFEAMRAGRSTAVIATHRMEFVRRFCDRALWLHRGEVMALGAAAGVVAAYERYRSDAQRESPRDPTPVEAVAARGA